MHSPRTEKALNVLLVGEESAGAQTLKLLAASPHRVVGVLASPTKEALGGLTVWQLAEKLGCRVWPAQLVKDPGFAEVIRDEQVDLLLNVHSLYLIAPEVVAAPRYGSFNLHPGPLPRYAGLNAVSWALYRGETQHGVTLHRMEPEIDTGPIVCQTLFPLVEHDTALKVYGKCIRAGLELIARLLATVAQDPLAIPLQAQDLTRREYFGKRAPNDCWISWEQSAREIYNLARACDYFPFPSPWGHPHALVRGREITLGKVRLSQRPCNAPPGTLGERNATDVAIACGDEWLWCEKLLIEGRFHSAAEALCGSDRLSYGVTG
jgi:UDP-4-amino-4-deoxy-L-arabinose formyltransferase/UDP-glucuronic acid dehydrogenase (UDP-4-keto-hexauronic acid decarboxylating)